VARVWLSKKEEGEGGGGCDLLVAPLASKESALIKMTSLSGMHKFMRDIYQNSAIVISWVGPEANRSSEMISTLRTVSQEIQAIPLGGDQFD
jgi:hypothetical protein